jgi:DNA-binding transcriptional LysR family regulator
VRPSLINIDVIAESKLGNPMGQMRLDLSLLEVFCCVYEHGSFTKAAEKMRLSQPTISSHIKNLETYVGAKLFNRLSRRIVPTHAGQILYRRGRHILDQKDEALRELNKYLNRVEGPLVVAASTIPGEYMLPQVIASFHSRFPAVSVELLISDSETACREVLKGRAEIGFAGAKLEGIGLEFSHFASDEMSLIVPNNDEWRRVETITLESLSTKPFLSREVGSGSRQAFEHMTGCTVDKLNVVGCFGSTSAIKESLKAGLGVSVLSTLAVKSEITSGILKTVKIEGIDIIVREFYMVTNKRFILSPIADAFLDVLGIPRKLDTATVVSKYGDDINPIALKRKME